jgi:hypothetical protein
VVILVLVLVLLMTMVVVLAVSRFLWQHSLLSIPAPGLPVSVLGF